MPTRKVRPHAQETQTNQAEERKNQAKELQARKFQSRQMRVEQLQELQTQQAEKKAAVAKQTKEEHPSGDKRFKVIDMALKRVGNSQDALIEVLHKIQETFGYLEDDVLTYVTRKMKLPLSMVYGVATFYHLFSLKPQGEHNCVVCLGTACYVKGSDKILTEISNYFGIKVGETTEDNQLSLLTARCIGACGIAPALTLDGKVFGKQTPELVLAGVKELLASGQAGVIKAKVEELTTA